MRLYSENKDYKLYHGNMLDMLEVIEPNSIDSIVTDPPYELNFMGKGWDNAGVSFNSDTWKKCYEVLKPGGYLLAFGGSRTYHRIACAIEDAGFEIRDTIMYLYGSGFPKSMDISKQLDKRNGRNTEIYKEIGKHIKEKREEKNISLKELNNIFGYVAGCNWWESQNDNNVRLPNYKDWLRLKELINVSDKYDEIILREEAIGEKIGEKVRGNAGFSKEQVPRPWKDKIGEVYDITAPSTDSAKQWKGWGTALKPSFEPIIVARKPFKGSLVDNVIKNGVGGINIDECRIEHNEVAKYTNRQPKNGAVFNTETSGYDNSQNHIASANELGRFPANTILTYDEDTDTTGWVRYFYCAKASKRDRDEGIKEYYQIILNKGDYKCEENMELVQLLQKVISGLEVENLNILEYGKNIMVIFPKECKSTILTEINKITELKTWNLLIQSLTKDYIVGASCETMNGGNLVENVENLKELKQTITNENQELVLGVSNVVYQMLLKIKGEENWKVANNSHCTVKPTDLMQYLVRLVTPNNGTILDPFNGSGSTGKAVMYENKDRNKNYKYIGIELTEEYLPIAQARIEYVCNLEEEKPTKQQISIYDLEASNSK